MSRGQRLPSQDERKAADIAYAAGRFNRGFYTGVLLAIRREEDPEETYKINPDFFPAEFWQEAKDGYDFYQNMASLVSL